MKLKQTLIILLSICLGIGLYFFSCNPTEEPASVQPEKSVEAVSAARQKIVTDYQRSSQVLKEKNDSLANTLSKQKKEMEYLKRQIRNLSGSMLQKTQLNDTAAIDTAETLEECEELKAEVAQLVTLCAAQDSLCTETVLNFEKVIENKDSLLSVTQHRVFETDSLFSQSLQYQRQLEKQLTDQSRQLKRKRREVSLLGTGLFVFSTVSLTLLLLK